MEIGFYVKKRERSVNFTPEETDRLICLIEKRKEIIENKKSDAITWQRKENAWKIIEKDFNNSGIRSEVLREAKHLKCKYDAMKRDIRKKMNVVSGGSNAVPLRLTPAEERVKSLLLLTAEGNDSLYVTNEYSVDIDVSPLQEDEEKNPLEEVEVKQEILWKPDVFDTNGLNPDLCNIDKLIGEMIALQNLPISFVEGTGFRRLMQVIAPEYKLAGQTYFTDFICNELYGRVTSKVKELIENFDYMSFTVNTFKDPSSNASFLCLNCHGVTENFVRSSFLLKCEQIDDDFKADIFSRKYEKVLKEWNISKEQVHCIVHGEGSNMKRVTQLPVSNELDCIVHKLQLAIKSCLQSQEAILEIEQKCRKISDHFHNSSFAQNRLQQFQARLNLPPISLFQDCIKQKRTFYMFKQFLKAKDALNLYCSNSIVESGFSNTPEEWRIIECCVALLKPFEEAIQELSSPQAHISSVIPIMQILMLKLDDQLINRMDVDPIQHAVTKLKSEVITKFSGLEQNNLLAISCYLDPRFKGKLFNSLIEEKIKEEILKQQTSNTNNDEQYIPSFQRAKRMRMSKGKLGTSIHEYLAKIVDSSSEDESQEIESESSSVAVLRKELYLYCNKKRLSVTENPLQWWSNNCSELKMLSAIARKYFSAPPSNVMDDKSYFDKELFNAPLSNNVDLDKVARLLFIKYNATVLNYNY